ncbi:MAG: metallophosphoesterase, partial [Senegalia sp. (in: firmicutes)]
MDKFIADLHLGDSKQSKKRGFKTTDEMHSHIIEEWNLVTSETDRVFLLGDVAKDPSFYNILEKLNGEIHVLLGNHEKPEYIPELLKYVETVSGLTKYLNNIYLSHVPVHSCQIGVKTNLNIHGHLHKKVIKSYVWDYDLKKELEVRHPNYINACVDIIGYSPLTL